MPHNTLSIIAPPFKSSRLAIPPSPFSPQFPITPPASPPPRTPQPSIHPNAIISPRHQHHHHHNARLIEAPPPEPPLPWTWRCCKCRQSYRLGVTRRCFNEGHHFCSGETIHKTNRRTRRKERVRIACESEFDYNGWKVWAGWRRRVQDRLEGGGGRNGAYGGMVAGVGKVPEPPFRSPLRSLSYSSASDVGYAREAGRLGRVGGKACGKDCWNQCDYPSECRWGKKYGVKTPMLPPPPPPPPPSVFPSTPGSRQTGLQPPTTVAPGQIESPTFDSTLLRLNSTPEPATPPQHTYSASLQNSIQQELQPAPAAEDAVSPTETAKPDVEELARCSERRRRRSSGLIPSPLASRPPSPPGEASAAALAPDPDRMEVGVQATPLPVAEPTGSETFCTASGLARTESLFESLGNDIRKGFGSMRGQLGRESSTDRDGSHDRRLLQPATAPEPMEDVMLTSAAADASVNVDSERPSLRRSLSTSRFRFGG